SYCAQVFLNDTEYNATKASFDGNLLNLEFAVPGVSAVIKTTAQANYIEWEVISCEGNKVDSFVFLNCPLTLNGKPEEPFGACSFALNTFTHVQQLPALQSHLWASCYDRFGIKGAKVALIGAPPGKMLSTIRTIAGNANDLPHNEVAGAWADEIPFNHGSYLFNFGTLTEETVDDWIDMVHSLGFNQIDNHGGGAGFFRFGDFHLNEEKWPDGWDNMKNIVARLHDAGIGSILHTYAFFIDKQSKYVTPVPHPGLDAFRTFTLAEPVDKSATEITVTESTADVSTITGFFERNSVTLHVGDELITFSGVTKELPYKFTGCTRGAYGTTASEHPKGAGARHLKECFGLFVPDCESELFTEIAKNHAELVDYCDFDGFYLDAIDGSDILRGSENTWYYGQKFVYEIYRHLKKPVGMEMSSMWHQMWNFRTRWQAWDYPNRGQKRFVDIHASTVNGGLMLPLHFGWWNFQHFSPPQVEPSYTDVIEYLGCKMIGYNAGLSLTGAVNKESLRTIPAYRRLVEMLHTYEELRHDNYFEEPVRAQLREPGKEFTLFQDEAKQWRFRRANYDKHKVTGLKNPDATWHTENPYGDQPVKARIELLMSAGKYDDPGAVVLAEFTKIDNTVAQSSAAGVTAELVSSSESIGTAATTVKYSALNNGTVAQNGAWSKAVKTFDPVIDLNKTQALGVWIKGDGNGELLNFRLESPRHIAYGAVADHYIDVDFTGWRYFELIETESTRWNDYTWEDGKWLYNVYRELINFKYIESISMWMNNVPPNGQGECFISPVKALPMITNVIKNPTITINGQQIQFPIEMQSGYYLELYAKDNCKLYGPKGELIAEVTPEQDIPLLKSGTNEITFTCDETTEFSTRVFVTVISYGEAL
ncbi:MAG: hypothetical protein JXB48_11325, partial [Candidatus Latescibacteria bacterium]|nr:hypothetical protein [Candidatus Latescibacterota bacterium]